MTNLDIFPIRDRPGETTIIVGWAPPVAAQGYVFLHDGKRLSSTLDGTVSQVKVARTNLPLTVRALRTMAEGSYPSTVTAGFDAPSYRVTLEPNNWDPDSPPASEKPYTGGWTKTARPDPLNRKDWDKAGYIRIADYPDEFVMLEAKQFEVPYLGRSTNFHLVGGDTVHNGVSPISLDWHQGRMTNQPADIPASSLVICSQAEKDGSNNRMHWLVLTEQELLADPSTTWSFEHRVRFRTDRSGYWHLRVFRNGAHFRDVNVDGIRTQYVEQKPELFLWLGGYESEGLPKQARMRQTLDHRGRTLAEAKADRPTLGSTMHTVSTVGGPDSSVVVAGTLRVSA